MKFTWDENKAAENLRKHGVSFETAALVFDDPDALYLEQTHANENRFSVIGYVNGRLCLFVVAVESGNDVTRIISAREATKNEKRLYENEAHRW